MSDAEPVRRFVHRPGDAWAVQAQMAVGRRLELELHPAGGYRWSAVECSDPNVASIAGSVDAGGTARFTVSALQSGTVVLSATTAHTGDRFGPQTRIWRLQLRVESET